MYPNAQTLWILSGYHVLWQRSDQHVLLRWGMAHQRSNKRLQVWRHREKGMAVPVKMEEERKRDKAKRNEREDKSKGHWNFSQPKLRWG